MSSHRNIVIVAFLVLVGGVGLSIWNATQAPVEKPTIESLKPQSPEMSGKNISFTVTEGEVKKWKINAAQAIYNETQTEAHLKEVKGTFFDKEGKAVMDFTAPVGEYANKDNKVLLTGGVVATSTKDNGGELHAPQMAWDAKAKEVVATGGIELIHAQGKSLAQMCTFDMDFSHINLKGGVTSTVSSPE